MTTSEFVNRPMTGYRVLDFTQNVAGPLAGQVFADLGAEVIKVEQPGGEAARRIVSTADGMHEIAPYFLPYNRGKRSLVVDMRTSSGVDAVLDLVRTSDVLVDGFRPGTMEAWGITRAAVRERNESCIVATLSAYGGNGSHGRRPGIDLLVQAESGMWTGLSDERGAPMRIPFTLVDAATGHVLAQAVMAALLQRERHGTTTDVDVAMYDVATSLQASRLTAELNRPADNTNSGREGLAKTSATSPFATSPSGIYKASDGYVVLAAYVPKHWAKLIQTVGCEHLANDPRFADQYSRAVNDAALTSELERVFSDFTVVDLVGRLQATGLMATEAKSVRQVVRSVLFEENQLTVVTSDGSRIERTLRTPARYSSFDPAATEPTPLLGEFGDLTTA